MAISTPGGTPVIEKRAGATRYIFPNVHMTNMLLHYASFSLTGLLISEFLFFKAFKASDICGPLTQILIYAATILMIFLTAALKSTIGKAVVTVSDYGVILQLGPRAFSSPIRVPCQDILQVMLTPMPRAVAPKTPKTTNTSALSELGAIVLHRRSAAPLVFADGYPCSSLQPLVTEIVDRFNITADCTDPSDQPIASGDTPAPHVAPASPLGLKRRLEKMDYPLNPLDRRITVAGSGERLAIRVPRVSAFWRPVSLMATGLLFAPMACFLIFGGIRYLYMALTGPSGAFLCAKTGTCLLLLFISSAILLVIIMAAVKTTTILADREKLSVQTSWGLFKRRRDFPANEISSFGVGEKLINSQYGSIVSHRLNVEQNSGTTSTILATVRLPEQQVGSIATMLRTFYKR